MIESIEACRGEAILFLVLLKSSECWNNGAMVEVNSNKLDRPLPVVDVVVISFQQANYLPALLDSLLAQTLVDWRAVVVNDGGTDNTDQVMSDYCARDPRISYVRQKNAGPGAARNRGLTFFPAQQAARYVTFIDGDDVLDPTYLAKLSKYLDLAPQAVAVGCHFDAIDETGKILGPGHRTRRAPKWRLPLDLPASQHLTPFVSFYCGTGQGPFYLFRRAIVEKTKGWTSEFWPHEDTDFATQMALKGEMHMLNQRLYLKREHTKNITNPDAGNNSPHHTPDAYPRFRYRWCRWQAEDRREEQLLADAHRYYMTWFSPFRDLTVAARVFRALLLTGQLRHLRWGSTLIWRALSHILRYHLLRLSPDRAKDAARFAPRPQ